MFRPSDLKVAPIPKKKGEFRMGKDRDEEGDKDKGEKGEKGERMKKLQDIFIKEEPPGYDRDFIIERLRENKQLLIPCNPKRMELIGKEEDREDKEKEDREDKGKEEKEEKRKEIISDEKGDERISDRVEKGKTKKIKNIQIRLAEQETEEPIPDDVYDPDTVMDEDGNLFIVCSTTSSKYLPGKAPSEVLVPGADFSQLHKIDNWRNVLCNTFASTFKLNGKTWQNVDHYMIAAKYTVPPEGIEDYAKARIIHIKQKGDVEFDRREEMFHALYAKFTQNDLLPVLSATKKAKLYYRVTSKTKEEFKELMILREMFRNVATKAVAAVAPVAVAPVVPVPVADSIARNEDFTKRLPSSAQRIITASSYYLNNRAQFVKRMDQVFKYYQAELRTDAAFTAEFQLLTHQKIVRDYMNVYTPYRGLLLYHGLGSGKCMAKGTPILLFNGRVKNVEDVTSGELLMGDDSTPRKVLSLATGRDRMYEVTSGGEAYVVNEEHILCLCVPTFPNITRTTEYRVQWIENNSFCEESFHESEAAEAFYNRVERTNIFEMSVKDYLQLSDAERAIFRGYQTSLHFPEKTVPINPYKCGVCFSSIPWEYKINSVATREKLLQGILDSKFVLCGKFYVNKDVDPPFLADVCFLARSLGVSVHVGKRTTIGLLEDRMAIRTAPLHVRYVGEDEYFGFTLTGNGRYVLGDCTVTHNTCTSIAIAEGLKSPKPIYVMLPAALRTNFWSELHKCGNEIYKKNQFWEFIATEKPEMVGQLAKALALPTSYITQQKGAWMVDVRKPPNYGTLSQSNQIAVQQQIQQMIARKYQNIHYNNPHLAKEIKTLTEKSGSLNMFDNAVIIIDEAHNFISRIVGKLAKKNSIYLHLYNLLLSATNCRIVMLTGTPIINSPHEMAVMFNILRGYIQTWEFPIERKTSAKVDNETIVELLHTNRLTTFDYVQIGRDNVLTITRNPFGFVNKYVHRRQTKKKISDEYDGITRDDMGNISNDEFVKRVKTILETNGLPLKGKSVLKVQKNLPDNRDIFYSTFLKDDAIDHIDVLRNRLMGMTSYFRSAAEDSLPAFVLSAKGTSYHEIVVEMSDFQFTEYAKIRLEEREQEKRRKRKQALDIDKVNSTFRIFSRACCNFVFPAIPGRPHPPRKEVDEDDDERIVEGNILDEDKDEGDENLNVVYLKRIEAAMTYMQEHAEEYLSTEGLEIYSPKYLQILDRIKETDGCQLLYSNFRTLEGIGLFKLVLEHHGMVEFKIIKDARGWKISPEAMVKGKQRFVLYTGTESEELKEVVRLIFNNSWSSAPAELLPDLRKLAKDNLQGDVIKLFMITSAGAEGISLHNTRVVHIMEPYWQNVRLEQVVGRARRINSHAELPVEMRNVTVYVYLSTLSDSQRTDEKYKDTILNDVGFVDKERTVTTDEYLYEVAQLKQKVNNQFLMLLKETAIDCRVYLSKHKNEPLVCYNSPFVDTNQFTVYPLIAQDIAEERV